MSRRNRVSHANNCKQKIRYETKGEASKAELKMRKKPSGMRRVGCFPYRCRECSSWHLGNRRKASNAHARSRRKNFLDYLALNDEPYFN